VGVIQTSRGCPFNCDFCSVSLFNGNHYRHRPVDEVIEELKAIKSKTVFILDDNILGVGKKNEERAMELFTKMKEAKLNKNWFSFASINFADKPEIMKAAAASGCYMIFIGFEAEGEEQLVEMNKNLNIKAGSDSYIKAVKRINRHKIYVMGGFIIGFDTDTKETILKRQQYILKNRINTVGLAFLTPLPGTVSYNELAKQNRITHNNYPADWNKYNFANVVYQPKNLTAAELNMLFYRIIISIYTKRNMRLRTFYTLLQTRSLRVTKLARHTNKKFFESYKNAYISYLKNMKAKANTQV
jgi:radical SAM superfamily enzyme YgiQ (UPF0313 family)